MKSESKKRLESFVWRLSMATLVFIFEWVAVNAGMTGLPLPITGIIALAAGEVSKYLNRRSV